MEVSRAGRGDGLPVQAQVDGVARRGRGRGEVGRGQFDALTQLRQWRQSRRPYVGDNLDRRDVDAVALGIKLDLQQGLHRRVDVPIRSHGDPVSDDVPRRPERGRIVAAAVVSHQLADACEVGVKKLQVDERRVLQRLLRLPVECQPHPLARPRHRRIDARGQQLHCAREGEHLRHEIIRQRGHDGRPGVGRGNDGHEAVDRRDQAQGHGRQLRPGSRPAAQTISRPQRQRQQRRKEQPPLIGRGAQHKL